MLIAFLALDAFAQFPGGGGTRGRSGGGRQQGGMPRGEAQQAPNDLVNLLDYRLETLQEDLKLSPAQQRYFDIFADRVRALGDDMMRERERARTPGLTQPTTPQQLDHLIDVTRNRMTALEDIAASAKTLYENLNAEQKLLADSRVSTLAPLLGGTAGNSGVPDPMRQKQIGRAHV